MRILHVTTSLGNGGAQAILFNLAQRCMEQEQVVISLMDDGKYGVALRKMGVTVHALNNPGGRMSLSSFRKLIKIISQTRPDLIQTWMYHGDLAGGVAGRLAGVKNIVWGIHNTNMDAQRTSRSTRLVIRVLTVLSHMIPRRIAVCSSAALEQHVEKGYSSRKMEFIPNGYDLEKFSPAVGDGNFSVFTEFTTEQRNAPVIGCVGRWSEQKDQMNLILACKELVEKGLTNFVCVFIGPDMGVDNLTLTRAISDFGLEDNIRLEGVHEDMPSVMRSLDFHVLPSAFGEAFPNVVAEAMSCGIPCIVTDVGDSMNMVQDSGWVVEPSNPFELASAMQDALAELGTPDWLVRKNRCREIALSDFGIDLMVSKYKRLWNLCVREA